MEQIPVQGKYQPYPEYKDSGVEWVGDMPHHWQTKPAFAVVMDQCIKNSDGAESNVLSLSYGNIVERDVENNFGLLPESFNTYQIVNQGDIVLRLTDLQNDKRSLRVARSTLRGIITSAYLKLACGKELDNRYAYRLLHSYDTTKVFYGMGGGLRQSMKFEDFRRLPFLLPPLEEQRTIAAFLDYETARIDKLIARQQRLIELLKEKRQAVISHAVTKGLNPDAPMKDSGVEWLGEVPEHWQVAKLSYVLKLKSGDGITSEDIEPEGSYPVFGGNGVRGYTTKYNCYGDFVLIGRQGALCGNINIAKGRFYASEHAVVVHPQKQCGITFISEFLRLMDLGQYSVSAAQPGISVERINMLYIALPPYAEQVSIGEQVTEVKAKIELLMMQASKGIELLKERRTALISAAVTGKIDLRGWTAPTQGQ
ncbi:restriction endonuclease subunit S [Klebsiella quasipneumoniae]|uniref:restriction endonuclease subunit S n=1 Tax=Klebsiella quasipneumoniae TaxID=1463165 RepID=UPI001CC46A1B|nr:restriction endonuclease subunit S [Klebsiella quasipneumoniae]MDV1057920.1 restriction endonuclease subunit S [Klebsiella quasipneumoniae subsp. similipneumoniae]UAW31732.1 restriction endonuclease subunit S [Klebsiella quasipneumoniae]